MFGFLKFLFATKAPAKTKPRAKAGPKAAPTSERERALAAIRAQSAQVMTPERQALIQHALSVQRAKRQILENLDDEARAKLVALTITQLMGEGDPPAPRKSQQPNRPGKGRH